MADDAARIDRRLLEELGDVLHEAVVQPVPTDCDDVTLLSSTWQKAIRRGDVQWAVRCALALQQRVPAYVWRRLRIIALEDVSFAHPRLVAQVLAIAGKRQRQRRLGEARLLIHLVTSLSLAPKSRTACELLTWAAARRGVNPADEAGLRRLIAHPAALPHSAGIVQSIAGMCTCRHGHWQVAVRANPRFRDLWLEATATPPLLAYIARRGGGSYGLNLMLVLAWQLARGAADLTHSCPAASSLEEIGGVPAYGYCMYSEPGRQALRHFLATPAPLPQEIKRTAPHCAWAALGHLVFHEEGDHCDTELVFPLASQIRRNSERATLLGAGLPPDQIPSLVARVPNALLALNASRHSVAVRGVRT